MSDAAKTTPEPSAPIQTPFPSTHFVPLALPPTRYTQAHTQPNLFLLFSSAIFALFLISKQRAGGLFCFASRMFCFEDWSSLLGGGQKKAEKSMCWRGWMVKQRMARNRATPFACPVKSRFCVSFQRLCSITAPVLALETVPPYYRTMTVQAFLKWCHRTSVCANF